MILNNVMLHYLLIICQLFHYVLLLAVSFRFHALPLKFRFRILWCYPRNWRGLQFEMLKYVSSNRLNNSIWLVCGASNIQEACHLLGQLYLFLAFFTDSFQLYQSTIAPEVPSFCMLTNILSKMSYKTQSSYTGPRTLSHLYLI